MLENGPKVISTQTISVGASATAYSDPFDLVDLDIFALEYRADCTGLPNVKIELEQSTDGTNWYTPDTFADINSSLTDKNYHGCQLTPITVRYARIKVTEATTTVDDTILYIKLSVQKRFQGLS